MARRRRFRRTLSYALQAGAAYLVYGLFALLPVEAASGLGGFLGRTIGPHLPVTGRARRNIARSMPDLAAPQLRAVIREMWDNLGRVLGEYPHLDAIIRNAGRGGRIEIAGEDNIAPLREPGRPCILFSGHLSNWEVLPFTLRHTGLSHAAVYRAPNNPFVERLLRRARRLESSDVVPKGARGARKAIAVLGAGGRLAMLVDQKMNNGIAVQFFGREAMTPSALAQLAFRFDCPMIPCRMERLGGCRFRVTFFPPLAVPRAGNRHQDVQAVMAAANRLIEGWIRERPGQWLWLHRRWPDS